MLRFCSSRDPLQEVLVPSPHEATTLPSRGLSGLPPKFNLQSSRSAEPPALYTHFRNIASLRRKALCGDGLLSA